MIVFFEFFLNFGSVVLDFNVISSIFTEGDFAKITEISADVEKKYTSSRTPAISRRVMLRSQYSRWF